MRTFLRWIISTMAALAALACMAPAIAAVPDGRVITIVVPYPPGGSTDASARIVAAKMAQFLGSPVIVENKPGAATLIGMQRVMQAHPDGLTLFLRRHRGHPEPAPAPGCQVTPIKDMKPVSLVGTASLVLVVRHDHPAKSLDDLVGMVRAGGHHQR